MKNNFRITIPVFNAEKFIEKCIDSVLTQTYSNWTALVVNDGSTDRTGEIAEQICAKDNRISVFNNPINEGPLASIVKCIAHLCKNGEDVVVNLDGDDWFYSNDVLEYLNEVYKDPSVWMTHGGVKPILGRLKFPENQPVKDYASYRKKEGWKVGHLRTFKKKLWDHIKDKDLRDSQGKYYRVSGDAAFIYPMVEMCGTLHRRKIERPLYIYNDTNPLAEDLLFKKQRIDTVREIRRKPIYTKLKDDI